MRSRNMVLLLMIFSFSFVSAANVEVGFGESQGQFGVNIVIPDAPVNQSNLSVGEANIWNTTSLGPLSDANSTQLNGVSGTLTIDESWLTAFINLILSTFNPFDQSLNTTDDVLFNTINSSTVIYENGTKLEDKYQPKATAGNMFMGFSDGFFVIKVA